MRRKRSRLIAVLVLLLALTGGVGWQTNALVRQERLDRALIAAIERDNTRLALDLLQRGADPNAKAVPGVSQPFWQLLWNSLWRRNLPQAGPCALLLAVKRPDPVLTRALLAKGARDVNARLYGDNDHNSCMTLLMLAVFQGDDESARALLDHGAQVNARDDMGASALMVADDRECADLLLQQGADVNARDCYGTTVLMHAVQNDRAWIARLLDHGADVNAANLSGRTALMQAVFYGEPDNVRLLLARGANPNAKESNGMTALKLANEVEVNTDAPVISSLLKRAGAKE